MESFSIFTLSATEACHSHSATAPILLGVASAWVTAVEHAGWCDVLCCEIDPAATLALRQQALVHFGTAQQPTDPSQPKDTFCRRTRVAGSSGGPCRCNELLAFRTTTLAIEILSTTLGLRLVESGHHSFTIP